MYADADKPGVVTCEWAPTSSTLGMGHMTSQKQLSYDTASLGRVTGEVDGGGVAATPPGSSHSCSHLAEVGRSRSDLGYVRPPAPQPPAVMMSPKKPPRMYQYNNSNSSLQHRRSVAADNIKPFNVPISKF